jgi:hypothetical protein
MATAELSAMRRSQVSGELIIAYECPDCRKFHIGHPDVSQVLARKSEIQLEANRLRKTGYTLLMDRTGSGQRILLAPRPIVSPNQQDNCRTCDGLISDEKKKIAAGSGSVAAYCSERCKRRAKKRRYANNKHPREWSLCTGEMK